MYSSTCNNANNPISYSTFYDAFPDDIEHHSKQEDRHSFLFQFSSPNNHSTVADDDDSMAILKHFQELLLQQQPLTMANCSLPEGMTKTADVNNNEGGLKGMASKQQSQRRACKKDRHSKIDTARGPRDRRMRLSLEVARKFFHLQDMLGFDKASKTVEWLLRMSKAAIKEVAGETKHTESASALECEVISFKKKRTPIAAKEETKLISALRRSTLKPLARESRARARARARELTRKKRRVHQSKLCFGAMNQLGSWTPFETGAELGARSIQSVDLSRFDMIGKAVDDPPPPPPPPSSISHEGYDHQGKELAEDDDVVGDPLVMTGNWSSSIIFNCQHNPGSPSQEHQSIDFQFYGNPLEAYNMNLV